MRLGKAEQWRQSGLRRSAWRASGRGMRLGWSPHLTSSPHCTTGGSTTAIAALPAPYEEHGVACPGSTAPHCTGVPCVGCRPPGTAVAPKPPPTPQGRALTTASSRPAPAGCPRWLSPGTPARPSRQTPACTSLHALWTCSAPCHCRHAEPRELQLLPRLLSACCPACSPAANPTRVPLPAPGHHPRTQRAVRHPAAGCHAPSQRPSQPSKHPSPRDPTTRRHAPWACGSRP